jgi:uncharacterized OsmC-like protein
MGIKMQELEPSLQHVEISVQKIMDNNPRRISGLNLTFHFPENFSATPEQRAQLEEIAWTCPVKQSINADIDLNINFNW